MNREPLMLICGACITLFPLTHVADGAEAPRRPNIVFILTDDMGFSDLGCFGGEIDTPNLDSLAANGLRFTEFYNTARCWPTRATLLSGRYSNGIKGGQVTIAEVLKAAGYDTGMVGKWHLGGNGWNTANNILAKAKAAGKTIAVGDKYDVPMGGPMTYGSVGHNWANAQNTPLRRYKMNVHNGGACTPAIVHWPAGLKTKPGSVSSQRGHVVDMMATCLELAGAKYPEAFNGKAIDPHESLSLAPIFAGGGNDRSHAYIFNHAGTHAIVRGDYKIVREGRGQWALYNLAGNRTETEDLAGQYPELVKEMAAIWDERWGKKKR